MKWLWLADQNNQNDPSLWNSTLASIGYSLPLEPTATSQTAISFFIKDIISLKPILKATTTRDDQSQLLWKLTPNHQFPQQPWYPTTYPTKDMDSAAATQNKILLMVSHAQQITNSRKFTTQRMANNYRMHHVCLS
jgi:hypothetical protein